VPESHQDAARAQGRARFEQFVEQLARHLQKGDSLVRGLRDTDVPPSDPASRHRDGAGLPAEGTA
jgi:hypothetical protein